MKHLLLALFVAASFTTAATAEEPATIRIAVEQAGGLVEVVPELHLAGELDGDRGCLTGGRECAEGLQIRAATGTAQPGQALRLGVEGTARAARLSVVFRGEVLLSREAVLLPADLPIPGIATEGRLHVSVEVEGRIVDSSIEVAEVGKLETATRATTGTAPQIRFFVNVAEEGVWEVITGSGTGGRLVTTRAYCMIPGIAVSLCPWQYRVQGYTDRARRGESVWTLVEGSGVASRIGVMIRGQIRGQWFNVPIPVLVPQTVSLSPHDDNVHAFLVWNGRYYERRLPIGTRPF